MSADPVGVLMGEVDELIERQIEDEQESLFDEDEVEEEYRRA